MPVTFTTDLPDAAQPTLGNGVEDEIAVAIDDVLNYGTYRVQARETTESAWPGAAPNSEVTISADGDLSGTEDTIIPSREDGEAYEVRVRTETEHATGAWTVPVEVTTEFPGASNLSVSNVGQTSLDLSWTDNSDNEDGFRVERRKFFGGSPGPWRTAATLSPNTTSYTDSTVQPQRTYEFRIEAFTEDAAALSGTVQTTTDSADVRQARVPSSGWHVKIDHADGHTLTPRLRDDPQIEQQVNGLPQLEIPVPRDTKWQAEGFEDAPVRVWRDGVPQPVDTLVDVEVTEAETTLTAGGGEALKQRVQRSVQFEDAHVVAEDLVSSNTPYEVTVDDPADSVDEVLMQSVDSEAEWESVLAGYPFPADDPRYVTSGGALATHQSALFRRGEDFDTSNGWTAFFADRFEGGTAYRSSAIGTDIRWDITTDYTIPSGSLEVAVRFGYQGTTHPGVEVQFGGTTVLSFSADTDIFGGGDQRWVTQTSAPGVDFSGTETLRVDVTGAASDSSSIYVDSVVVYDSRYTEGITDDDLTDGGRLSWPHLHPSAIQSETSDASALNQVVGGRIDSTWDSTANNQAVALSNDQGGTYPVSASNSETVDGSFPSSSGQIRARVTQSYYDSGGGPVVNDAGQTVDLLEVYADQEETPVLIDRTFDGRLVEVLTQIAEDKNFVYELRRDRDGFSFEMAQLGQRSSDADPSVAQYSVSKNTGDVVEKAVIKGGSQVREGEQATANHGTWVALDQDNLVAGGEAVTDGAGTQYERGTDYEMDYLDGELKTLSAGSITDGDTLTLSYQYKPVASYTKAGVSDPKTVVRSLPAIQSEQTAEQVAYYLVLEFGDPIYSATITIPDSAGWSVIDEVAPSQVPTAGAALQTKAIETSPEATVIRAASEEGLDEAIQRINSRLAAAETKV